MNTGSNEAITYEPEYNDGLDKSSLQSKFLKRGGIQLPFTEDNSRSYSLRFGDIDGDGDTDVMYTTSEYDQDTWD